MANPNLPSLLLTVFLVTTAGCGAVATPSEPSTTDAPLSPTPSSSDANSGERARLAPGLTEAGVTDAWALAQAHRDTLANGTYLEQTDHSVHANGTHLRNLSTTLQRGHDDRYIYELHVDGTQVSSPRNVTVVRNDSTLVQRTRYENGTVAYTGPENAITPPTDQYGNVYAVFTASNTTVETTVEQHGQTRYRLTSVGAPFESSAYAGVDDYEMSALVGPDGLVHEYHLSYQTTHDGRTVTVTIDCQFTNVGESIARPLEWILDQEDEAE